MHGLKLRLLAVALLASALGGCVTTQNTLTKADVAAFKLTDVRVSVAPDARIAWYEPLQAHAATKKIPDEQYTEWMKTDEAKGHINGIITGKIKGQMEKQLTGQLNGSRPVRIEVVVTQFIVPTAAQRVIIGGSNVMTADVNVVDAKTGALILAHPKFTWQVQGGQGIAGVIAQAIVDSAMQPATDSMIEQHAMFYKIWLINDAKKV
jgi:hypothetical protein